MKWLFWLSVVIFVAGVSIAIWERRKKRTLLAHDLNAAGPQTEADRQAIRTVHEMTGRETSRPPD
ncbi:hypothetical protein [uncultured Roseobacter sp.]|uniref:hypothetical protein n=1 Tax=uncultured Roseobacter sp. TaxID=114847 RepID=UPI00262BD31D|nr:hypothetical protein [uncultured Roseobacter sp.]